jgi:predicted metalloenzyme YecM
LEFSIKLVSIVEIVYEFLIFSLQDINSVIVRFKVDFEFKEFSYGFLSCGELLSKSVAIVLGLLIIILKLGVDIDTLEILLFPFESLSFEVTYLLIN